MSNDKATKMAAQQALQAKRAVLYARVSGDDRGKDGRNLKSQLDMCREYAQSKGYTIVAELHEDDRGASGASFELPVLTQVLEMAERKEYDVLVVRELDRLSRNLAKQLIVEESLKRCGVGVEYVLADYDDTPEGNLQKHIRATVAEYEREKIKERSVRGKRNKVKTGKVVAGSLAAPYGYRLTEDRTGFVVYESEAAIVQMIFGWYTGNNPENETLSSYQIAERLSGMSVPTWADVNRSLIPKKRGTGVWSPFTVLSILHNETYAGTWHFGKYGFLNGRNPPETWVAIAVPAIVTPELWQAAQAKMKENKSTSKRNVSREYLMRYRLRCECGYAALACWRPGRNLDYIYYCCRSKDGTYANAYCGLPYFRADHVDALVWQWFKDRIQDEDKLRLELESYQEERERREAPLRAQIESCEDLLERHTGERRRVEDMYQLGVIKRDDLIERTTRLDDTIARLQKQHAELTAGLESDGLSSEGIEAILEFVRKRKRALEKADQSFEERCKLIELWDVRAILCVVDGRKKVKPYFFLSGPEDSEAIDLSVATTTTRCS